MRAEDGVSGSPAVAATAHRRSPGRDEPGLHGAEAPFGPALSYISRDRLTPLLQRVERPGRYVGGEFGRPSKSLEHAQARLVLSYPDTYELGMSNQGLKILYDVVNRQPDLVADRAFLPWPDFGAALADAGLPLYSLDHFAEVRSFDVWGFNTAHELHFTNLLYALDLARIPLLRRDRGPGDPLIITGGTAVSNPLPLFDFIDGIFMGDGEEAIVEILRIVAAAKASGLSRLELIEQLREVEGLLLPEFYELQERAGEYPRYDGPLVTKRSYFSKEFAALEYFLVPNVDITQDRVVVEVNRGCGQGCRFCHAGFWKRPVRTAEVATLVRNAREMLAKTGNDSVSLHSLSLADYRWLEELVVEMANEFGPEGISLSLPSLRVQVKTIPVLQMTQGIRRSSVTFALEAGSELMRERIRKKSSEENLHYLMREIFARGWDLVKVYLMVGLPDRDGTETDELIRALNVFGEIAEAAGPRKNVNVTVSLFVPKPFTTFQWEEQRSPEYFSDAIVRIKRGLRSKRVHLKYPDPWMAYVEGLLSRADSRVGPWLVEAYRRGARFDSWDDGFRHEVWQNLLAEIPEHLRQLWLAQRPGGSEAPWHDLIEGKTISREKLTQDFDKFEKVNEENMSPPHPQALVPSDFPEELLKPVSIPDTKFRTHCVLELEFTKAGPLIYVGHLNLIEVIRKAARRARLPMTFSQGFNKHEKLHLTDALPLYVFSESERVFIELFEEPELAVSHAALAANLPEGLGIRSARLHDRLPSVASADAYRYRLEFSAEQDALLIVERLEQAPETITVERKERKRKKLRKLRRGESAMRRVEKRVRSAIRSIERRGSTVAFVMDSPNVGAASLADLATLHLELPVADWNTRVRVIREGRVHG